MTAASSKSGLPLSLPATTWSSEQALAVFELLTEIRDRIWDQYNVQIQSELRDQIQPQKEMK